MPHRAGRDEKSAGDDGNASAAHRRGSRVLRHRQMRVSVSEQSGTEGESGAARPVDRARYGRIRQWIARVNEAEEGDDVANDAIPSSAPTSVGTPELSDNASERGMQHGRASSRVHRRRRRRHHTRPLVRTEHASSPVASASAAAVSSVVNRVSNRLRSRVPTILWQMAYERLWKAQPSLDAHVWLMGELYAAPEDVPLPFAALSTSEARCESNISDASSASASDSGIASHDVHDDLNAAVRSLISFTYRRNFSPIPSERTAKAAAKALSSYAPAPQAGAPAQSPVSTLVSLVDAVLHSSDNLPTSAIWLAQQLKARGWELLEPHLEHAEASSAFPCVWSGVHTAFQHILSLTQPTCFTSDEGWGCMLRTVQSLLANALMRVHCGRGWRRRTDKVDPMHARIISWCQDDPSDACPFSVHRLVAQGERLGVPAGEWFGPSTAAFAVKHLVDAYSACGMGAVVTNDGMVYTDEIRQASIAPGETDAWTRPVLVLVVTRLGLEQVPSKHYAALKHTFSIPQSVGIVGGRPRSSLYFVGVQRDLLLCFNPHHTKSCIPFKGCARSAPHTETKSKASKDTKAESSGEAVSTAECEAMPAEPDPQAQGAKADGSTAAHPAKGVADTDASDRSAGLDDAWFEHAYTREELDTFHTTHTSTLPIACMDPSMLLGFVCERASDVVELQAHVDACETRIFDFAEHMPSYARTAGHDTESESYEIDESWVET